MDVSTTQQIAIKAATTAAIVLMVGRVHRHHPKLAKGLLWSGAAMTAGIAARNYQIARR